MHTCKYCELDPLLAFSYTQLSLFFGLAQCKSGWCKMEDEWVVQVGRWVVLLAFCELVSKRFMFQLCATCAQQWCCLCRFSLQMRL